MPATFAITTTTTTVPLDGGRRGSATFTVSNTSGRALHARARIVPADPAAAGWLALDGPAEQAFPAAGTQQYTVLIAAPPNAPAGSYPFRLDVAGVDNPGAEFSSGPSVTFQVPTPAPPPKPFPWWIVIAAGALLLLIVGVVAFLLVQDNTQKMAAAARFDGLWQLSSADATLHHSGATVQGTYNDYVRGLNGTIQGDVASNGTLSGQWTLADHSTGALAMTVDAAGKTLTGSDPFCGARDGEFFPAGCSFAGAWRDNNNCPVTIQIKSSGGSREISGAACGVANGLGPGNLSYAPQGVSAGGPYNARGFPAGFTVYLHNNALQFTGRIESDSSGIEPWCGSRSGQPLPKPCDQTAP